MQEAIGGTTHRIPENKVTLLCSRIVVGCVHDCRGVLECFTGHDVAGASAALQHAEEKGNSFFAVLMGDEGKIQDFKIL